MKYIHLLPALLAAFITFAHPLIDPEHESPVEVREAAAAPNSPPSMNPLPYETDGVLLDGTVVNSAISVNSVNESCWTLPNIPLIHSSSPAYLPDTCQICGIQGGVGPVAWYAAWVRDANNSAVGNMPVVDLGPGTSVGKTWQFSAAGGFLTMLVLPGEHPTSASAVSMMWGDQPEPQMYFDPIGTDSINCSLQGDAQDGTVTYFQCHFDCGLALDPSTRRSLDMAHSEREYREDNSPSVSHQQPRQVEKRSPPLSLAPFPPENDAELLDGTDAVINPNPDNNVKATPFVEPNTTNVIIHTRQAPVGAGTDSGISVSTYAGENCQGDEGFTYEKLLYNVELAHALQSYSLSSDLGPDDVLGYATATPCSDSFFTLGAQDITQGCHTLPEEANCMAIWVSSG